MPALWSPPPIHQLRFSRLPRFSKVSRILRLDWRCGTVLALSPVHSAIASAGAQPGVGEVAAALPRTSIDRGDSMNRREFFINAASVAVCTLMPVRQIRAEDGLKPLDLTHPPAHALAYVENVGEVDPVTHPAGSEQRCDNCQHFQPAAAPAPDRGGCALFPGFSVTARGWCTGWVAER